MASTKHTIATYNMSFASDAGLDPKRAGVFESEAAFHLSNDTGNSRQFWLNALGFVSDFWTNVPDASVMGLQEINKTAVGTATGSAVVESSVKAAVASRASAFDVKVVTEEFVVNPNVKPALMLIWNSTKLGTESKRSISDLDYVPGEEAVEEVAKPNGSRVKKSGKQSGRPILMVMTSGGYLLVTCHAPNHAELSAKSLVDLRAALNSKIGDFIGAEPISKDKVFIMGDFNDRFDSLTKIDLTIGGTQVALSYKGKAPLSCCHNWDSSCTASRYTPMAIAGRKNVGTCDPQGQPLAGPGARTAMGVEGNIENYRYYGDKVFGSIPSKAANGNIQTYPPGRIGASKESDHEMVIATFVSAAAGGKRKSLRKKQKKYLHNKRNTRKGGALKFNNIWGKDIPEEAFPEYHESIGQTHNNAVYSAQSVRQKYNILSYATGHGTNTKASSSGTLDELKKSLEGCDINDVLIVKVGCNDNEYIGGTLGVKTPIYFPKWESLEPVMQTHLLSKLINKIGDKKIHLRVISPEFEYLNYGFPWLNNKNAGTVAGDARNRIFSLKLTSSKYIRKFFPLTQDNPEAPEIISFIKEWKGPVIIMNAVGEDVRHTTFNKIAETAFYIKMVDQAPKGAFLYDL